MIQKYQKKSHHVKKTKTENDIARDDWRLQKRILRDKAKRLGVVGHCFSDGVPPWMKRQCNKKHRRWEKECLHKNDDQKLPHKGKLKNIFDPWMWF